MPKYTITCGEGRAKYKNKKTKKQKTFGTKYCKFNPGPSDHVSKCQT